jgi:predicted outer membrane protein
MGSMELGSACSHLRRGAVGHFATMMSSESPMERALRAVRRGSRKDERAEGKLIRASSQEKERIMLRKRLAAMFIPLFITTTGAALAGSPASGGADTSEKAAQLSENFSLLHAVNQWSVKVSETADKSAKSDLVKGYAHAMATANPNLDAKLLDIAQKHGIAIKPLDPATEEGKSVLDRMNGQTVLLGSLQGDAWDKDYMTLVTNMQQSVLHLLESSKALTKDPEVKQFLGDLTTTIQNRLKTAQDVMAKVYGNEI